MGLFAVGLVSGKEIQIRLEPGVGLGSFFALNDAIQFIDDRGARGVLLTTNVEYVREVTEHAE